MALPCQSWAAHLAPPAWTASVRSLWLSPVSSVLMASMPSGQEPVSTAAQGE